jgi:hypothetical protein
MKFICITLAIVATSSRVFAGVIGVSDQLERLKEKVAAADLISGLLSKAVRCGGMCLLLDKKRKSHRQSARKPPAERVF